MANQEQLSILKKSLKQRDPRIWNRWRFNQHERIDLSEADLSGLHFGRIDIQTVPAEEELGDDGWGRFSLSRVSLRGANLRDSTFDVTVLMGADLSDADLTGAKMSNVFLNGAILSNANLSYADLTRAELDGGTFEETFFYQTKLGHTSIVDANLTSAKFVECKDFGASFARSNLAHATFIRCKVTADFFQANLTEADFAASDLSLANFNGTILCSLDVSTIHGLENAVHGGPSIIGMDTLAKSRGAIPGAFLRGCGLSDWEIEQAKLYNPVLGNEEISKILYRIYDLRATQALQLSPLFISYSRKDSEFVDKVANKLTGIGVRYWQDTHDMKAGRIEKQIDRAIQQNPTMLLVLSENSLSSDWVEHEVRTARGLEKETGRDVLCPVALDDSWKSSQWPKRVMEQIMEYNILDFSEWQDDSKFDDIFRKLIDGLDVFYKG